MMIIKRNAYSILFAIFTVLNFGILKLWFPHAMAGLPAIIWLGVHGFAYFGYVEPAEKKLCEKKGWE